MLTNVGGRGDDDQTASGRFTAAFQPFDGFEGVVQYQHDAVNDVGDVATISPIAQVLPGDFDEKRFPNYAPTSNKATANRIHWEFTYGNLPLGASLTYSGGYDSSHWRHALDASGNAKYSTSYYFDVFNFADTRQRQYATADASPTYAPASGHFEVGVFVRNLTDKAVFANAQRNFTAIPAINACQFQAPRTCGARLSFNS